jgi:hypothetical protein
MWWPTPLLGIKTNFVQPLFVIHVTHVVVNTTAMNDNGSLFSQSFLTHVVVNTTARNNNGSLLNLSYLAQLAVMTISQLIKTDTSGKLLKYVLYIDRTFSNSKAHILTRPEELKNFHINKEIFFIYKACSMYSIQYMSQHIYLYIIPPKKFRTN